MWIGRNQKGRGEGGKRVGEKEKGIEVERRERGMQD